MVMRAPIGEGLFIASAEYMYLTTTDRQRIGALANYRKKMISLTLRSLKSIFRKEALKRS